MKAGDGFNPYRGSCGFYPPDVVSRLGPFTLLKSRRKFTAIHKLLYVRLVRRWGQNGPCFPSQQRLAGDLGTSERSIRRGLDDLEEFGLIQRRHRGRGKGGVGQNDAYTFLWHPIFDRTKPKDMTGQNGQFERPKTTGSYKEESHTSQSRAEETRQHHPAHDVACSTEEAEILEMAGLARTRANVKALREYLSAGISIENIRGGVALGRLRHMNNPAARPIVSVRFFANPIAEAAEAYSSDQLEHTVHRLRRELQRKKGESGARTEDMVA